MVKIKKALKKLAKIGSQSLAGASASKRPKVAAQPAKKAGPARKTAKLDAGKKAAKPAAKPVMGKSAAKSAPAKNAKVAVKAKPTAKTPTTKLPAVAKKAAVKALVDDKASARAGLGKKPEARGGKAVKPGPITVKEATRGAKESRSAKKPNKTDVSEKDSAVVESLSVETEEQTESNGAEEVYLTDAEGRRYCRVKDCDQIATVDGYCRYHYLLFWKRIQVRKKILSEGKLSRYIEELTARYPDKYLEMLRKDLRSEKDFMAAITELEIDESGVDSEYEDEAQSYLEEVRGMSSEGGGREEEEF